MYKLSGVIAIISFVASCTTTNLSDSSAVPVTIEGQQLFAQPFGNSPGTWRAGPADIFERKGMSPQEYLRYSAAIEQASGCKVIIGPERWANGYLITAVNCID